MKNVIIKSLFVLSFVTISIFANSQEAVMLKYNFVKGKTYILSSKLSTNVTQTMGPQEIKVENGIISNSDMQIEDVDNNGNATSLVTLKSASIHTKIPAMNRDTTMNFNDLNEQRRVVFASTGKEISSITITPEKVMKMMSSASQFTRIQNLPGKSINTGEKWNDKLIDSTKANQQSPVNMAISTDMEYSLVGKEVKDGVELLKISFSGAITITGKGNMQGMDLFVEGTGKSEGFSYFNPKTSLVVNTESNTEMDMSIAVSGQQNMTMPMTQSIKISTTLTEKN